MTGGAGAADGSSVTVVVTCYRYGHLLAEALESVLGQTWPPGRVIVVDDGSPDDTAAVAGGFAGRGVDYLRRPNGGPGAARNTGAARCTTPYLVFLDADDRLAPTYLERTVPVLAASPPEVAYVYTQCRYFGARQGDTAFPRWDLRRLLRWPFVHASALLRADVARRHPYDEAGTPGVEDWDFYLTLAEHGYRGVLLDEPLLLYRKHADPSRGDRFELDPAVDRRFRQVLRRHWRLGGPVHALRVEGYYAKRALERRLRALRRGRAGAAAEPARQPGHQPRR